MTDEAIDMLEGAALDVAVAAVMDPRPESMPDGWMAFAVRHSAAGWWKLLANSKVWSPARSISTDGGNIAVELLEKLREWGFYPGVEWAGSDWVASSSTHLQLGVGDDIGTAVARLLLRVARDRGQYGT